MSTTTLVIILVILVLGNSLFFWFVLMKRKGAEGEVSKNEPALNLLLQQINELSRTVDMKIGENTRQVSDSLRLQSSDWLKNIKEVTEGLTYVRETGRQMMGSMDKLQELQDILKNPKQRGILGEYYLETLLKNVLPTGSYQTQYAFKDGTIVDAVVFVKEKVIPIDSKFSLENYNRLVEEKDPLEKERLEKAFKADLKNRIDETSKYVKPAEGTMDFAFMFIPHEAIYYDLLVSQVGAVKVNTRDLIDYAFKDKKVIIVSPTSFLAYLQTVLQGLKALQIEESAKEIIVKVESLGKHLGAYDQFMNSLGSSLGTTVNHYNRAHKELQKIDKDVLKIAGISQGIEAISVEKPEITE